MKIIKARKDFPCSGENGELGTKCSIAGKMIKAGELYCLAIKFTKGYGKIAKSEALRYHWSCWEGFRIGELNAQRTEIQARKAKEERRGRKKNPVGKPRKYQDPYEASKIVSLICYHRGKGNEERVGELQAELDKLLIGG